MLHTAVVRALEVIEPLSDDPSEFPKAFLRREMGKCFYSILESLGQGP